MAASIRIVSVPLGEAPLSVREKWVGLVIPISNDLPQCVPHTAVGICSGLSVSVNGFSVDAGKALAILAAMSPDAARWWWTNAAWVYSDGVYFDFDASACELVDE